MNRGIIFLGGGGNFFLKGEGNITSCFHGGNCPWVGFFFSGGGSTTIPILCLSSSHSLSKFKTLRVHTPFPQPLLSCLYICMSILFIVSHPPSLSHSLLLCLFLSRSFSVFFYIKQDCQNIHSFSIFLSAYQI